MSYLNDPRERAIRPESGITLEQDDRVETMYHWGAMVLDLCDLPVEEYMKPMPVNVVSGGTGGGGGDDSGATYNLTYKVSGSTYATQQYHYGDTIVPPADPEVPEGYAFRGWDGLPATMPKRSVTVDAIVEEIGPGPEPSGATEYTFYFTWLYNSDLDSAGAAAKIAQRLASSGESVTATTELSEHVILNVPGDDDCDWSDEWMDEHKFSFVVAIPVESTLVTVKQGSEANINMVGTEMETSRGNVELSGANYKVVSFFKEGSDAYIVMDEDSMTPIQFYITLE